MDVPAEKLLFIAATATVDERLVDGNVTATRIFDEKCGVGDVIKKLLDDRQLGGNARRDFRERTGKR